MINKYTNKQRGLLAVVLAIAMVFAGAAFVAAEVDANDSATGVEATILYVGGEVIDEAANVGTQQNPYKTIAEALSGKTPGNYIIELKGDVEGNGWTNPSGLNLTINFNGYKFTANGGLVASGEVKTIVFQLLKDSDVTFNNGTIYTEVEGASMLIQNYSNLTLNNMVLDGSGLNNDDYNYTLSVNSGNVNISGKTTIVASNYEADDPNYAFDACYSKSFYPDGTKVVLNTTGVINGDVEVGTWTGDNGGESKTVLEVKSGTIDGNIMFTTSSGSELVVASGVDVDVVIPEGIIATGSVSFVNETDVNKVSFTTLKAGVGGITFSEGSVIIDGTVTEGTVIVDDGTARIVSDIPTGVTISLDDEVTLIIDDGVEIKGTITVTGSTATIATPVGYDLSEVMNESNLEKIEQTSNTQYTESFGMSKDLESDYTVKTSAFLEKDLTIPEGITLTISGKLDLNGKELTVKGTLVVENNGYITSMDGGKIAIGPKGTIVNDGIIGKDGAVMVHLIGDEGNMVSVEDAIGLGFGQIKNVSGDEVSYKLSISGDVKKKADAQPTITIIGNVTVVDTLSIGNGVTLKVDDGATLTVSKNALLEITSKGQIDSKGTGADAGKVALASGSEVVLDGESNVIFTAETGKYLTSGDKLLSTTYLAIANAKGLILTVESASQYDDELEADVTEVRFIIAGTLDAVKTDDDFDANGNATVNFGIYVTGISEEKAIDNYVGIHVDDALTIGKDIMNIEFHEEAKVTVNGTVTYAGDYIEEALNHFSVAVIGAYYAVEATSAEGAKTTTHYIKSFDAAFAAIDTSVDKTITVYGDVEIASDMIVLADQVIEGSATYTIDEEAVLTLENDSEFNASIVDVKGAFVVKVDVTIDVNDEIKYNAMSKDSETGDVTYYGFLAALNNAKEGDVIEISKETEVEDSFTIPAGVTIKVLDDGELIAKKNLNVAGTLINEGEVSVGGKTTVSGNVDLTEETSSTFDDTITVTGEIVMNGKYDDTNMNGAYYVNDDGEYVYTTPAKAVEGVSGKDVGREVRIVGKVSDSTALALDNMTLRIEGEAELGDVTISKSKVVIGAGPFSGTIIGNYGAEETTGAVNDVVVILKDAQYMDIENSSKANSENIKVWSTTINSTDNDDLLYGDIIVDKGVLTVKEDLYVDYISGSDTKINTVTVSEDAGLLVPNGSTLTVDYYEDKALLTVDGTLDIDGTFDIYGNVIINGFMDVAPGKDLEPAVSVNITTISTSAGGTDTIYGNLIITGDLVIGEDEDYTPCTFNIIGILTIGDKPTSIGTTGSLAGPVNNLSGYIIAYDGADLSAAKIDWNTNDKSDAKSTTFNINGQPYMTVYTDADVMYDAVLRSAEIELAGYTIENITDVTKWFTDADLTKKAANNKIGTDEDLYFKAAPKTVPFQVSIGTGISLYIDDVKVISTTDLSVGTHSISAVVDPGYKGEVTISFNGVAVTDGKIVVTPEMTSASYDGLTVISATGEITADSGTVIVEPSGEDDGMELTDILLIVLVVLIVIMAIIVALRMMRS